MPDPVNEQYEAWPFPNPSSGLRPGALWNDPTANAPMFWPHGAPEALRILVAGCGTTEAVRFAVACPTAQVVGIDISRTSLNHARAMGAMHDVDNLELVLLSLDRAAELGREFDLISVGGVLHHLTDPTEGLRGLASVLAPEGVIAAAVYGARARAGLNALQATFRELGVPRTKAGLQTVREVMKRLPAHHAAWRWFARVGEKGEDDNHLIDVCLPGHELPWGVADVLSHVDAAGLAFQGWLRERPYHPEALYAPGSTPHRAFEDLEGPALWSAMARLTEPLDHFFVACRRDRPAQRWQRPRGVAVASAVPVRRPGTPPRWASPSARHLLDHADGVRTVGELGMELEEVEALRRRDLIWLRPNGSDPRGLIVR